jgi:Ni/Co efflux regulator RcnB
MSAVRSKLWRAALFALAAGFAAGAAQAEKPDWAGKGKGGKAAKHGKADDHRARVAPHGYFGERHRTVVHEYYGRQFHAGRCPPGLAKKHNGCMPPGQAKKWAVGQPLPRGVVYYEVPPRLVIEIGTPPRGYKYVRVAGDILLIAIGTSLVVDAIADIGAL